MRILNITLDLKIPAWEIPNLREAISIRMGKEENELFHMHNTNRSEHWNYRTHYPLIQFNMFHERIRVTGINKGAEDLQCLLLPELIGEWEFKGRKEYISSFQVENKEVELTFGEKQQPFRLYQWQALNNQNYKIWDACRDDEDAQLDLLSRVLTGHLRSFAEGLEKPYFKAIEGKVTKLLRTKKIKWHGVDFISFDVEAESSFKVPFGIGIGRKTAYGFGRTGKIRTKYTENFREKIREELSL